MARVTVEDCLERVPNRFALVVLAAQRARQLLRDAEPLVESKNKECVTSLREIADGKVGFDEDIQQILQGNITKDKRRRRRR
ncbi:MAG: DNA-directed RNA polymerase subunit omega [Bradymonadales bacterium]|nr:DNA-directed RNA polymerase subunit omega [Bradymonadales bacterium]